MREDKKQCESVGWQFYQQGKWWNGDDRIKDHRKNTEEAGIPTRDVFARPAQQGQGEPVAEVVSAYSGDPDSRGNKVIKPLASLPEVGTKLYTHADPADVAQLELEIEQLRLSLTLNDCASDEDDCVRAENRQLNTEVERLRAQLLLRLGQLGAVPPMPATADRRAHNDAEPDGYLESDKDWYDNNSDAVAWLIENHAAIRAALSANAEPSAPVDPDQIALDCATEIMRLLDKLPIPGGRGQLKSQIQCRVCAALERKS